MLIYPAIDLLQGRCVRLEQGGFDRSTVYADDPMAMLKSFEVAGATYLHLVDLSGAKSPADRQLPLISKIVSSTHLRVQTGGGIRTFEQASELLAAGVDRVVIGSAAISQPDLVLRLLSQFGGEKVTVALDVRLNDSGIPCVALHGWKDQSAVTVEQALKPLLSKNTGTPGNLQRVLCTDISRDGMMRGPNVKLYQNLMAQFPTLEFQASGGVSNLADLLELKRSGMRSAVVGKAIYEGAIDLKEAIEQC